MDEFTQFQLREYENISQAHFKTNEVQATFYRYFIIITAIPITTIGLALMNLSGKTVDDEARILAHFILGGSAVLLSAFGVAVIAYIESLRLDTILYARVVNSIRSYFFKSEKASEFGLPVLPTDEEKPGFDGFGAGFIIYYTCSAMNAAYFAVGVLVLSMNRNIPLTEATITKCQWFATLAAIFGAMIVQIAVRWYLIWVKKRAAKKRLSVPQ